MLLKDHLQQLSQEELELFCEDLHMLTVPETKDEIIDLVCPRLLNQYFLTHLLCTLSDEDFSLFTKTELSLEEAEPILDDTFCYVLYYKDDTTLKICDDVKEAVYDEIDLDDLKVLQKRLSPVYRMIVLVNFLYGATPLKIFKQCLKSCFKLELSDAEVVDAINEITSSIPLCVFLSDTIVEPALVNTYYTLVEIEHPYFIPRMEDLEMYETKYVIVPDDVYQNAIHTFSQVQDYEPKLIVAVISDMIHYGRDMNDIVTTINDAFELQLTQESTPYVIDTIVKLYNTTKRIENHGYSPNEYKNFSKVN